MPRRKRDHEDASNNHVKDSKDLPQRKKLRKNPAKISSDEQNKPLNDPIAETRCEQRRRDAPDILHKKVPTRNQDHEDATKNHVKDSKDLPQRKNIRKKPAEKSSDEQKEPLDDPIADTLCRRRFIPTKQTENAMLTLNRDYQDAADAVIPRPALRICSGTPSIDDPRIKLLRLVYHHDQLKISFQQMSSHIRGGLLEAEDGFAQLMKLVEMAGEGRFSSIVVINDHDRSEEHTQDGPQPKKKSK